MFRLSPDRYLTPIQRFRRDGWDDLIYLSVAHDTAKQIIVFGGYLGDSTQSWLNHQPNAEIHVFEPVPIFAEKIMNRFMGRSVIVHPFGVSAEDEKRQFELAKDGSRSCTPSNPVAIDPSTTVTTEFVAIHKLAGQFENAFDVLEINIEGGEYELVPLLASSGLIGRTQNIFVQPHSIGSSTEQQFGRMKTLLSSTHELVWSYEMVWEYWRLRSDKSSY